MTDTHTVPDALPARDDVASALAAELVSLADQADANAVRYSQHPDDHGGIGSASRAFRTIATSLRWRAADITAQTTGAAVMAPAGERLALEGQTRLGERRPT